MVGAGIGAGIGGLVGGAAGFMGSDTGRLLYPKDNPASFMSGRHLNTAPFRLSQVKRDSIEKGYMTEAANAYEQGSSRYPNSTFPQRMTSRQWDSATGDVVLGAYNLRRG